MINGGVLPQNFINSVGKMDFPISLYSIIISMNTASMLSAEPEVGFSKSSAADSTMKRYLSVS